MSKLELRPCPACGSMGGSPNKRYLPELRGHPNRYRVTCSTLCELQGPIGDTEEEAIRLWNTLPRTDNEVAQALAVTLAKAGIGITLTDAERGHIPHLCSTCRHRRTCAGWQDANAGTLCSIYMPEP